MSRGHTGHSKRPLPTTLETTLHMDIPRWLTPKNLLLIIKATFIWITRSTDSSGAISRTLGPGRDPGAWAPCCSLPLHRRLPFCHKSEIPVFGEDSLPLHLHSATARPSLSHEQTARPTLGPAVRLYPNLTLAHCTFPQPTHYLPMSPAFPGWH